MKRQYKFIATLLILTFASFANGRTRYFELKTLKKGKELSFPVFSRTNDSIATKNINQLLQLSELELLDGYQTNNIFEKVSIDNGTIYGGKVEISYQLFSNNSKLLSIKFSESSCGATCAYWVRYYNFNSGNGDLIKLKDLFTPKGFTAFSRNVLKKRTTKFKKQLTKIDSSERANFLDVLSCYENDDLHDYYIKGTSIIIDGENCLSKNQKFDGLDMITRFDFAEFKNCLNNYGKVVFGMTNDSISEYHSYVLPQLFEGTIGSSLKILLIINHGYKNKMRGVYAYLKYGRGIYLEGELNDQELSMTENTEDFNENGYLNATFDGKEINGTWTNKKKTKTLKFIAIRRIAMTQQ